MVISDHARTSGETVLECERSGRGSRRNAELAEDVLHVPGDGVLADHKRCGDLLVALPRGDQAKHLQLTGRQPVFRRLACPGERIHQGDIGCRSQLLESAPSRIELQRESVLVAKELARSPHQHTHVRDFVWSLELLPCMARLAKSHERRAGIAFGMPITNCTCMGSSMRPRLARLTAL